MPLLFLSHSGIDAAGARALKARILAAAPALVEVWLDEDSLEPGKLWQPQIEDAIAKSSAFAVYFGTDGVLNWVDLVQRQMLAGPRPQSSARRTHRSTAALCETATCKSLRPIRIQAVELLRPESPNGSAPPAPLLRP